MSAQRTTHSILMLWVDRDLNKPFWGYIHPNSNNATNTYGSYHDITPATYFDVARCVSREFKLPVGGKGIIIRKRSTDFKVRRSNVYSTYKNIGSIFCPVLGSIELTRLGWRHMFRKARSSAHKGASLDVIPYIKKVMSQKPTEHAVTDVKYIEKAGYQYRQAEHLLKFNQVKLCKVDKTLKTVTVVSRVLEEIRYPVDWAETAMLSQRVTRKCVLKTIYHKE